MIKASVIIPNYNGLHFLKPCLAALDGQSTKDFTVCVVDNGSADGSVSYLENERPDIKLIRFDKNTGFCHAVNAGVLWAKTPYVILLNNDTVPDKNFVRELVGGIEKDKKIFSCASCMLTKEDNEILDGAGDLYSALGWAFARGKGEKADKYEKPCFVFSACAGAAVYRTREFKELGMLDEKHFAYLEDMDLAWRAKLAGYKNRYIPSAKVVHLGSGTTGSRHNSFKVRLSARNNIYMIRKNMAPWQKVINALPIAVGTLIKYIYFKRKGLGADYLKGLKEGRLLSVKVPKETSFGTQMAVQKELFVNAFRRRG